MKTIKRLLVALSLFLILGSNIYGYNVSETNVVDDETINLSLDGDMQLPLGEVDGDIKVFKPLDIDFSIRDLEDNKKISISLMNPIEENTSYSLFLISGTDGSIDFSTDSNLDGVTIMNSDNSGEGQNIEKVIINNSNNLDVYFNEELQESDFEFELLGELDIDSLSSDDQRTIKLRLSDKLTKDSNYIAMILSVKDSLGNDIFFDESLYNFETDSELKEYVPDDVIDSENNNMDNNTDIMLGEDNLDNLLVDNIDNDSMTSSGSMDDDIELNSAGLPDELPETGPTTWVLLLLTMIINVSIFARKKFLKS